MKKILKAKTSHPDKEVFRISELTYNDTFSPMYESLIEDLKDTDLINPIEVFLHLKSNQQRMGAQGIPYKEKRYTINKGSQRVKAAKELGYTHIEGVLIND